MITMKNDREYRDMQLRAVANEEYKVEGYASTFEPYVLFSMDDIDYKEQIMPTAFDECDMTDCVFRVDHEGTVYARTSAGTVEVHTDEHGLKTTADLSRTAKARGVWEDIEAGNYPKMSFAFTVGADHYDPATHTRYIDKIDKLYDVSPVTWPANPGTELSVKTRDYFNGVIEAEQAERLAEELRQKKLELLRRLI